ncbi:hypothetical protein WMY93_021047 [Mugilogobius chulae]|uniref:Calponin-homology (CH) domain-containing protein n=1 Tax=Mugilogobius chulae TaxID=88201 RepID=A0AAW0NEH0_9GOBI
MAAENPTDSAGSLTKESLAAIEDEDTLNRMLDNAKNFEERSMIRSALRELLRRKIDKRKEERGERQATLNNNPTSPSAALNQTSPTTALPNAKNVKQMLLDWCRAKTEPYEGVDIQNFSSSWKDGIAFCALVHRFFPDAFEYSILNPNKPRDNFQLAFSTAERLAGCPSLLDPDDLVRMREPDWKCVYTYIQEFYRCLVEKGLVKTKKRT